MQKFAYQENGCSGFNKKCSHIFDHIQSGLYWKLKNATLSVTARAEHGNSY